MNGNIDLFVPGRICLFGEHSDWAGGHRRMNSEIVPGYAMICGTNQGIRARIQPHPDRLIFHSSVDVDGVRQVFDVPMRAGVLLEEARNGGFFSYVAGVAYQALLHHDVKGLVIDNYSTDLPIRKGLSSSAAVCVLTARAFNLGYDLKMTVRGEMDLAYRGEITTPSRCGRMDQGCAFGSRPVLMEFDGDALGVTEIACGADFHFIIADLKASKDTVRILADLNEAYPFARDEIGRRVQEYLGPINKRILENARTALGAGDPARLGAIMTETQQLFDSCVAPASPTQLAAPALHRVLGHPGLAPFVWGGKGVGSQGDGSVQLLAKDAAAREAAISILESELGLSCVRLTIAKSSRIRKAVITAAGYGTRLFPMTSVLRKEFLPVVDHKGRMIPLILAKVEEVVEAGIQQVCIVIQEQDRKIFEDFFAQDISPEHYEKLSAAARESLAAIRDLGRRVFLLPQREQRGLGDAVYQVREWVNGEPFLLVLGDHLFVPHGKTGCVKQVVERFEEAEMTLVALQPTPEHQIGRYGAATGTWEEAERRDVLELSLVKEKPTVDFAKEFLAVPEMPSGTYLAFFGLYALTPAIFPELERCVQSAQNSDQEAQLTDALENLRHYERLLGVVIEGEKIDVGIPTAYIEGLVQYAGYARPSP